MKRGKGLFDGSFLFLRFSLHQMRVAPFFHVSQNRDETFPQIGQGILHLRRHFLIDIAGDESVLLQFAELLGKGGVDCVMSPSLRLSSPNLCTSYSAMYHNIVIFHFPLRMFCILTIAAHWGSGAFILLMWFPPFGSIIRYFFSKCKVLCFLIPVSFFAL